MIYLTMAAAFLAAAFATGLTGYGFGLVAMGILPFILSVADANGVATLLALPLTLVAIFPLRRFISFRLIWPLLVGAVVGVPFGVVYLTRLDERVVRATLGGVILVALAASIFSALRARRAQAAPAIGAPAPEARAAESVDLDHGDAASVSPPADAAVPAVPAERRLPVWIAVPVGAVSGAFGGAFAVSGPPVVIYFNEVLRDKTVIKANLLAYFLFVIAVRLPTLVISGVIRLDLAVTALWMAPAVAVGLFAGTALHNRLSSGAVRAAIQLLLAVSAALLIAGK